MADDLPALDASQFQEPTLSSEVPVGLPKRPAAPPGTPTALTPRSRARLPGQHPLAPAGLELLNRMDQDAAVAALLNCCGSRHWAERLAAHRPYPDLDVLLAACDEASYDLSPADLHEALAREPAAGPDRALTDVPTSALTALAAAHAAYESRFGHSFVISLVTFRPAEHLDQILIGIRARLAHTPDTEREVAAEELRGLARSRLIRLVS
ncbi:2-oxo-4-hydroxy-4-carboxy-5-ureidoimidazoline decarboxylase [Streptomyces sp. NBC_00690]